MKSYLTIIEIPNPGRRTKVWNVRSKRSGVLLAVIRWYAQWRQYCVFPEASIVFNVGCLNELIEFVDVQIEARK